MSIISGVREYMAACPLLAMIPLKDRHIDWTNANSPNYGIFPDEDITVKKFISGGGKHEYNFMVKFRLTANELKELENAEFVENMKKWAAEKNAAKEFPVLPEGCTPTAIEAASGIMDERDNSKKTALYSMQFKLKYMEVIKT